jgi:hypothetical protein
VNDDAVPLPDPGTVAPSVSDPQIEPLKANDTAADMSCIIIKGVENWFLTGGTNDPDSIDTVVQIGLFRVLKRVDFKSRGLLSAPTQQHEVLRRRTVDKITY